VARCVVRTSLEPESFLEAIVKATQNPLIGV
jgi:hypothetical protein